MCNFCGIDKAETQSAYDALLAVTRKLAEDRDRWRETARALAEAVRQRHGHEGYTDAYCDVCIALARFHEQDQQSSSSGEKRSST